MYPRFSETLLKELLDEFRILYLTGPRQAGKTTLARKIANDLGMHYFWFPRAGVGTDSGRASVPFSIFLRTIWVPQNLVKLPIDFGEAF